ncbi:unnamed protein product [Ectocarpus sp. 4 AP-2014]
MKDLWTLVLLSGFAWRAESWLLPANQPRQAIRAQRGGTTSTTALPSSFRRSRAIAGRGTLAGRTAGEGRSTPGVRRLEAAKSGENKPWDFFKSVLTLGVKKKKPPEVEVAIIGAGVAGLVCARILTRGGFSVRLLEASDGVGGRVRTDEVDGFLLDRGFQVFIEAYPEPTRQLNYKTLKLQKFDPGAIVRYDGGFHLVSDPIRKPGAIVDALVAPVGTLVDKIRVGLHRIAIVFQKDEEIFGAPEETTYDFLTDTLGLSSSMVSRFFAPFYQGIFLSPLEEQSSLLFNFVFKMFSVGSASLPEGGMGEVPKQIAADLPDGCLLLNTKVVSMDKIEEDDYDDDEGEGDALLPYSGSFDGSPRVRLTLEDGSELLAHAAVVATEAPVAAELLGEEVALGGGASPSTGRSSTCLYYAIDGPAPVGGPILVLNGEGAKSSGPVNNVVFLEQTAPSYAPAGKSLASVTVVGSPDCSDSELEAKVRAHLAEWFDKNKGGDAGAGGLPTRGADVAKWKHLRTYRVPYAQPAQRPPVREGGFYGREVQVDDAIFVCGDHRATPTLDGAMKSGVLAGEAVTTDLIAGESRPIVRKGQPYRRRKQVRV